jgi:hypothetical protein
LAARVEDRRHCLSVRRREVTTGNADVAGEGTPRSNPKTLSGCPIVIASRVDRSAISSVGPITL